MVRLYYVNKATGLEDLIGDFDTIGELYTNISLFLEKVKFPSYYRREWTDPEGWTWIDFGSHISFYKYRGFITIQGYIQDENGLLYPDPNDIKIEYTDEFAIGDYKDIIDSGTDSSCEPRLLEDNAALNIQIPTLYTVESSNIKAIGVDDYRTLFIQFKSGKVYYYDDVEIVDRNEFIFADSKGKYFASIIKPKYTGSPIEITDPIVYLDIEYLQRKVINDFINNANKAFEKALGYRNMIKWLKEDLFLVSGNIGLDEIEIGTINNIIANVISGDDTKETRDQLKIELDKIYNLSGE